MNKIIFLCVVGVFFTVCFSSTVQAASVKSDARIVFFGDDDKQNLVPKDTIIPSGVKAENAPERIAVLPKTGDSNSCYIFLGIFLIVLSGFNLTEKRRMVI
ncbi:hypothetical protein C1910_05095 [Listeria ivanovii]|uniref:LPXTG cell wall anchor domain-containing protein n=1 Tax=Listeria ivanovii TaxID=1638 RepID=UPI000DA773C8|nr:LPXTG cell wall anchor domain-containing protein [Listeria ivanovii]PZG39256.1 hypothetical protein C1910_05095 [Listeria ivanovii]